MADIYGSDISTFAGPGDTLGLDPLFRPITGPRVALEGFVRRLLVPPEGIPGVLTMDLRSIVQKRMNAVELARIEADIRAIAERHETILSLPVVQIERTAHNAYRLRVRARLAEGPFDLVLGISSVTIEILTIDRG